MATTMGHIKRKELAEKTGVCSVSYAKMLVWKAARTTVAAILLHGNMAVEGRQQKRRQDYRQKQRRIFASSVLHLL